MNLSLLILFAVFGVIAARKIGRVPVKIWHAMAAGALLVLVTGQISPSGAMQAIDLDVMVFLFGMFVVGEGLILSGYLSALAYRILHRVTSADGLVLTLLFGAGLTSAVLMNDTLAIVGTPLVLRLAREHRLEPRLLLMTLAVAVTTGSVLSPIGNPQNLLIAVDGPVPSSFVTFLQALALPTLLNLLLAYVVLRIMWPTAFHATTLVHSEVVIRDHALARLARLALFLLLGLIALRIACVALAVPLEFRLSYLAMAAALPLLVFSRRRVELLRRMDWSTLLFFASMFVLMASVWQTGVFQGWTAHLQMDLTSLPSILGLSIVLSQLISNVPLVALYLPLVSEAPGSLPALLALAAGSTIAGNLCILGAASNVIIIQRAEQEGHTLSFVTFAWIGVPLTILQTLVYAVYLQWVLG
ncbi:MAG: SLC13 family permease [Nitrospirota bacterium]|nr:SLC13 family permease [Nitrospirota bacterium]MDH5295653.1 SLC13 family permease [Nitrospirota bacterium]